MTESTETMEPSSMTAEASALSTVRESDNAFVRGVLFLQGIVSAAPSLTRGVWRHYGKRRVHALGNKIRNYRPHPALYLAIALAVFGGASFVQSHTWAVGVSVNGTYIGAVESRAMFADAETYVSSEATDALGYSYNLEDEAIRTYPVIAANGKMLTEEALVSEICEANPAVSYSYVLKIDGQPVSLSPDQGAIEAALAAKLNAAKTENTISAEFVQNLGVSREIIAQEDASSYLGLSDLMNATSQEEVIYTIQAGDTWSEIADRYGMSSQSLLDLNPSHDMNRIHEGEELTVSAAVPLLSVKTVDRVQYEAPVPYETEYKDDSSLYQGETRVLTKGINGLADVDAHVSYVDGMETSRNIITSTTIQEPVTQVMAKGTRERPKTMASGSFAWPTHGRISSGFGYRSSPGGIGSRNHKGIDIAGARGRTISASDGGTVTYAGWMRGYGYLVQIDHGNGYQTRYAHNSKLSVSRGDKVYKGQKIAEMGSTGNSTGNHCHFEIRLNGTPVNPMRYLP